MTLESKVQMPSQEEWRRYRFFYSQYLIRPTEENYTRFRVLRDYLCEEYTYSKEELNQELELYLKNK